MDNMPTGMDIVTVERFDELTGTRRGFYSVSVDNVANIKPINTGMLKGMWAFWRLRTGGNTGPWIISESSARLLYASLISRDSALTRAAAILRTLSAGYETRVIILFDELTTAPGRYSNLLNRPRPIFETKQVTSHMDGEVIAFFHAVRNRRLVRYLDLRDNDMHYPKCDFCCADIKDFSPRHRRTLVLADSPMYRAFCLQCRGEELNARFIR